MIELRWVESDGGCMQLQQRTCGVQVDASGAFCGFGDGSEWTAVPTVPAVPATST